MGSLQPDIAGVIELLDVPANATPDIEAEVTSLFDLYRAPLLRFLLSLGLTTADGEETIQEVFLALCKHLRAGKPRENLRAWLFQVGHNQGLKLRQRRPAPYLPPSAIPTPEQLAIESQSRRHLALAIEALPELDRACLALRAEGLRYREIAQVLGISLGGVALALDRSITRLRRAREK